MFWQALVGIVQSDVSDPIIQLSPYDGRISISKIHSSAECFGIFSEYRKRVASVGFLLNSFYRRTLHFYLGKIIIPLNVVPSRWSCIWLWVYQSHTEEFPSIRRNPLKVIISLNMNRGNVTLENNKNHRCHRGRHQPLSDVLRAMLF